MTQNPMMADDAAPPATGPAQAQPTVSHMLGELTWLLTQSPTHRHFTFADMEWMILPPLMLEQYRVFRTAPPPSKGGSPDRAAFSGDTMGKTGGDGQAGDKMVSPEKAQTPPPQPIGYATWASLSEEAEAKLLAGADTGTGARLRPDEWKSGDRLWLVDMVIPKATAQNKLSEACLADLLQGPLKGKKVKFHRTDPETGKRDVVELG